ncbi:hypothetical protein SLA2020_013900 [Shorea laevis]
MHIPLLTKYAWRLDSKVSIGYRFSIFGGILEVDSEEGLGSTFRRKAIKTITNRDSFTSGVLKRRVGR